MLTMETSLIPSHSCHDTWIRTFFLLNAHADELDNPDQRICDDVSNFVSVSVLLTMNLSRKLFNCVAFAGKDLY